MRNINLVIVDIQPHYMPWFRNNTLSNVAKAIQTATNIIWYYNGPEVGVNDSDGCVKDMISDYLDYEYLDSIKFVEKGYGFLRGWMDRGEDSDKILSALKTLEKNGLCDSRDIEEFSDDYDPIYLPHLDNPQLDFTHICGGGEFQCLAEMELMFQHWGTKTEKIQSAVY